MPRAVYTRAAIGVAVLSLQALAIGQQHFGPTRYFAWAPNDYIVQYEIKVNVGGQDLTSTQIGNRYRHLYNPSTSSAGKLALTGVFESPPQHLIDELRQYEETYGRSDHAQVTLTYNLDGRAAETWKYPS